jgi:Domain of unknown function (DUF3883)
VSVHDEYANISPWNSYETTDIVYEDSAGILTSLLCQKGYLERSKWDGRSLTYYIEVKTTIGRCETPFYCSQNQFDMMEKMQLVENVSDCVYLIARVFNVGTSGTGLQIHVDPATLRQQGRLEFFADEYKVKSV